MRAKPPNGVSKGKDEPAGSLTTTVCVLCGHVKRKSHESSREVTSKFALVPSMEISAFAGLCKIAFAILI